MLTKPLHCSGCPLYGSGQGFSVSEGSGKNGILILGEALGRNEAFDGKPFRAYAESGSVLEAALQRLGLNRQDFLLYNIVNCQPPFNKLKGTNYEQEAVEHCSYYVKQLIKKHKPKIILVLGDLPLEYTWEEYPELTAKLENSLLSKQEKRAFAKKLGITSVRGYLLPSIHGIPMISSLHPSFIRRTGMVYLGVLIRDIRLAVLYSQGKTPKLKTDYKVNPSDEELQRLLDYLQRNPSNPISYDIETPYTTIETDEKDIDYRHIEVRDIDSIQFSIAEGQAIYLTLGDKQINANNWEWARKFLELPNQKIGFNSWEFDDTNIKFHFGNAYPKNGSLDVMWMCKFYNQDFGSSKLASHGLGLQWNASLLNEGLPLWKHLSNDDPFTYGNYDVDFTLRNFNVLTKEFKDRRLTEDCFGNKVEVSKTMLEGFQDDILKLNPILKQAAARGFPISIKEKETYKKRIKEEIVRVYSDLQSKYPKSLLRRKPVKGYKNDPKEVTEIINTFNNIRRLDNEYNFALAIPSHINGDSNTNLYYGSIEPSLLPKLIEKITKNKEGESGLILKEFTLDNGVKQKRWCRLEDFKVGSKDQVLAYIEWKGYKLKKKKNKQTNKFEYTTSKDVITQLYEETKDDFLGNIVYLRELDKLLSTYLGEGKKSSEWKIVDIDEDGIGVVHTTFGYWPVSGQLSSRNPNIQNQPKYGNQWSSEGYAKLAKDFRKIIKARRGKVLIEFDYKSYHALTTAFEAEDADYMRLVRLDIHSYFAAHIIRSGFSIEKNKLNSKLLFAKGEQKAEILAKLAKLEETVTFIKDLDNWLKYDDNILKQKLKWIKENHEFIRNRMAKPTILGIPYGMGPKRLYEENIRNFESKEQAAQLLALIHKLFPKIRKWQDAIRKQADKKGYLLSRYGYLQRFYNVYDYRPLKEKRREQWDEQIFLGKDGRWWSKKAGSDAENVVSFYPQTDAFSKIKEAMRECEELGYLEKYRFVNTIHDSLLFECPVEFVSECIENVKVVMEKPAKYLINSIAPQGLTCSVDVSIGQDWGSLKEI